MDAKTPQMEIVRQMIMGLSKKERRALLASLARDLPECGAPSGTYKSIDEFLHEKLGGEIACPYCASRNVVKWSLCANGTRRYKCKGCMHTFTLSRNTVFFHARKDLQTIRSYVKGLAGKETVRTAAKNCGIGIRTSFLWRHRILDSLHGVMDGVLLDGVVEADEFFFPISYKGARGLPRDAHRRGEKATKRGLSDEKVCVPCAVNRDGKSVAAVSNLGKVSRADLENVFAAHAVEGTVWCSDKDASYPGFAEKHGLDLVQFKSGGKRTQGVFHIQHVNAYHSNVRRMADHHFRGVSTKYLNSYLLWYNFSDYGGGTTDMLMDRLAYYRTRQRKRDIWSRPALPLLRAA